MPNYAAQWEAVWKPYAQYGSKSTDAGIKALVEGIEKIPLLGNLRQLNVFFGEVDNYRRGCQNLRSNPTNPTFAQAEQRLRSAVMTVRSNFLENLTKAIELCAEVAAYFKASLQVVKGDPQHQNMVKGILILLPRMSNGLTSEVSEYGTRITTTLDNIRRNP